MGCWASARKTIMTMVAKMRKTILTMREQEKELVKLREVKRKVLLARSLNKNLWRDFSFKTTSRIIAFNTLFNHPHHYKRLSSIP